MQPEGTELPPAGTIVGLPPGWPRSGWLALMPGAPGRLVAARLWTSRRAQPQPDDPAWGSRIWDVAPAAPLYLVRHPGLVPGAVAAVALPDTPMFVHELSPAARRLTLGAHTVELDLVRPARPGERRRLFVTSGPARALLWDWKDDSDDAELLEIVRWAGDLDRDGRLDLVIDFSTYFKTSTCLFLSGAARPPQPMQRVACWQTSA